MEPSEQGESDEAREAEVENIVKSPEAVEDCWELVVTKSKTHTQHGKTKQTREQATLE